MMFTEWSPELVEALAAPFAPGDHKTKSQGGSQITFVDVHRYKERLNATVGPHGWSTSVRMEPVGGKLIATVSLTVLGVTKENVGDEVEVPEVNERGNEKIIGSPATNSYAQAFKRACSDFGLGDYLYDERKREAAKRGGSSNGNGSDAPPREYAATQKQYGLIEKLMKSSVITEGERDSLSARATRGMSKSEASKAIDWLTEEIERRKATATIPPDA